MKKKAFDKMKHLANTLQLHDTVLTKAQIMFSGYRDEMEALHDFHSVIAACVISAWRGRTAALLACMLCSRACSARVHALLACMLYSVVSNAIC